MISKLRSWLISYFTKTAATANIWMRGLYVVGFFWNISEIVFKIQLCEFWWCSHMCLRYSAVWKFMSIHGHSVQREHEAHTGDAWYEPHLISPQVFHDTEHNIIFSNWEQKTALSPHTYSTHTHVHMKGISITNDWKKMMMTNNYVLQGQKYTNGVGAVPQRMMGSASDTCSLQMVCQRRPAGAYKNTRHPSELFCYCLAGTLLSGLSQAFVASEGMLQRKQLDNTEFMSTHYARMFLGGGAHSNGFLKVLALWINAQVVYVYIENRFSHHFLIWNGNNLRGDGQTRLWEAASKEATEESGLRGEDAADSLTHFITHNLLKTCPAGRCSVFQVPGPRTEGSAEWQKEVFYVRDKEDPRWVEKKQKRKIREGTEDRLQRRNVSGFVAAWKTSLGTRNLTAGGQKTCPSPASLQEVGEKKMMATLSAIMDNTSHPPCGSLSAQGSSLYSVQLHK